MRLCFFNVLFFLCSPVVIASAQGLPANPWLTSHEQINNPIVNDATNIVNSIPANAPLNEQFNYSKDMQEFQNMAASIKEKINVGGSTATNSSSNDSDVNTVDALKALNTLSKYMNKNQTQNSSYSNNTSSELSGIKSKLQRVMSKNNSYSGNTNNFQSQKLQKITRQYNNYKSQMKSSYYNLRNQAEPLINVMKQSINEAEKTAGVSF